MFENALSIWQFSSPHFEEVEQKSSRMLAEYRMQLKTNVAKESPDKRIKLTELVLKLGWQNVKTSTEWDEVTTRIQEKLWQKQDGSLLLASLWKAAEEMEQYQKSLTDSAQAWQIVADKIIEEQKALNAALLQKAYVLITESGFMTAFSTTVDGSDVQKQAVREEDNLRKGRKIELSQVQFRMRCCG